MYHINFVLTDLLLFFSSSSLLSVLMSVSDFFLVLCLCLSLPLSLFLFLYLCLIYLFFFLYVYLSVYLSFYLFVSLFSILYYLFSFADNGKIWQRALWDPRGIRTAGWMEAPPTETVSHGSKNSTRTSRASSYSSSAPKVD